MLKILAIDVIIIYYCYEPFTNPALTNFEIHSACKNHEPRVLQGQNDASLVN
jgi:hypothetical protein